MVFDLIVSALVTVLVVTLTDGILTFFGNGLMNIGYRSAWIGPGGLRPSVRTMILTAAALLSFCLTFYFLMRETIRYIGKILEKVKEISAGDFDHPIEVKGNDEFSVMAENLNTMQQNIKEIMERERIAEHTKNDLVSSVAHDLRTPLTSIIGYLGWVRTRTDLAEETRNHYIDIAYQKALRLEQLTNELFGFVKLEHKEMQLHLRKLDLVQLMEQMLDEMTPSFVKNELQVEFLHAEHAIFLEADGELLARLFGNLLNNAVKYGKEENRSASQWKKRANMWSRVSLTTDGSFQNRNWIIFSRNFTGQSSRGAAIPAGRDLDLRLYSRLRNCITDRCG